VRRLDQLSAGTKKARQRVDGDSGLEPYGILQLDAEDTQLGFTYVFHGVRSQRLAPDNRRNGRRRYRTSRVKNQIARLVAPHMVAPILQIENSWPPVCVHRNRVATRDAHFQDSDAIVLKCPTMVLWRRD